MAVTFIEEVKQFYFRYGGPHSQHQGIQPSLLLSNMLQADTSIVFSKAPSFLDAVGPRVAKSVTPVLLNTNRSATPTQFPIGGNHVVKRISSLLAQQAVKHEEHAQSGARPQQVKKQATPLKRKRKSLSPAKSEVEEEKPAVRRSNRVSNKNVNYEESDGSSPARAVSPGESDVSGFDPSNRSDISASPDQSPPRRKREKPALQSQSTRGGGPKVGIGSFSSSMDDYLERLSRITSPANARSRPQTTTIPHGTENATRRDNSLLRPPQHYRIPHVTQAFPNVAISHSRPPTRHGPPNDQQSNSSIGDVAQPPATPNFFSNQQTPQVMPHQSFLPTNHAHNIREDTNQLSTNRLMGFPPRNNFLSQGGVSSSTVYGHIVPAQSPYDRMRLSFSATADLTPPPTSTEATPLTTDPKKRKQPVSSPLQTTNKRPRLSFPGDDFPNNAPTLLKQIPSRSSPSRMQAEATAGHHQDMPYKEQLNQLSTPAPNLAPTAVMYQPSLRPDQVSIVTNGGQDGQVGVVEDGYNDESFDALIEEDKFSTELPEFIFG